MKTLSKIIIFFFLFLGVLGISTAYGNQPSYNPSPTAPLENDKSEDAQPENDEEDFQGHYRQKPVICSYEIEKVFKYLDTEGAVIFGRWYRPADNAYITMWIDKTGDDRGQVTILETYPQVNLVCTVSGGLDFQVNENFATEEEKEDYKKEQELEKQKDEPIQQKYSTEGGTSI